MTVYFVRMGGSDSGVGSYVDPFRTVYHAMNVWGAGDAIDVGEGDFAEPQPLPVTKSFGVIYGKGWDKTSLGAVGAVDHLFEVNNAAVRGLSISHMTIDQAVSGVNLLWVNNSHAQARLSLFRCVLRLRDVAAVVYGGTNPDVRIDLLQNVVYAPIKYNGIAMMSSQSNVVAAYNCIFAKLGLVVDDVLNGRPCDLNYNLYYDNARTLRIGEHGAQDLVDIDPEFVDLAKGNVRVRVTSAARDAGLDLRNGYGTPSRTPPPAANTGFGGTYPDIGVEEMMFDTAALKMKASTMGLFLQTFGEPLGVVRDDELNVKRSLFLSSGTTRDMQGRMGEALGVYRLL